MILYLIFTCFIVFCSVLLNKKLINQKAFISICSFLSKNQPTGSGSCTGDHWDERMFYPEALSGVISPTANIMSPITLALLEDSGMNLP